MTNYNCSVNTGLKGTTGTGEFVGSISPTITTPVIAQINDASGNTIAAFSSGPNAVNYLTLFDAVTGQYPGILASGSDTNIFATIASQGDAGIRLYTSAVSAYPLIIYSGTSFQHLTQFSFSNTSANRTVTFPDASGTVALIDSNNNLSANNFIEGYTTTATAASSTTLTVASTFQQFFTGTTTQTVVLPVTSTLVLGQAFYIVNNSTGVVTVESSGANAIQAMAANTTLLVTCILITGTTAASWYADYNFQTALTLPLSLANGGTNNDITASAGGIPWSDSSKINLLAGTATAGLALLSGDAATPSWSGSAPVLVGSLGTGVGTALGDAVTGSGGIVLSTTPTITTPIIGYIYDSNSKNMIQFATNASAVNYFEMQNQPTGDAPSLAAVGSDTNVSMQLSGQGTGGVNLKGTTAGGNAAAGYVGEYISSQVTAASAVNAGGNNTATQVTTIALTAGDWDVGGSVGITINSATVTQFAGSINTSVATTDNSLNLLLSATGLGASSGCIPTQRVSLSGNQTMYLVGLSAYSVATPKFYGFIWARRKR